MLVCFVSYQLVLVSSQVSSGRQVTTIRNVKRSRRGVRGKTRRRRRRKMRLKRRRRLGFFMMKPFSPPLVDMIELRIKWNFMQFNLV